MDVREVPLVFLLVVQRKEVARGQEKWSRMVLVVVVVVVGRAVGESGGQQSSAHWTG